MRRFLLASTAVVVLLSPPVSAFAQDSSHADGVLVIAHGAKAEWNAPVIAAVQRVRRTVPAAVGFLMGDGPTPQQAYDALVSQGASRVMVVPLLVSSHSAHAEQIRFLAGRRPDYPHAEHMHLVPVAGPVPIVGVTPAMDDDPLIAAILADRARALSRDPSEETLVLVAHGPNDDGAAERWTAAMRTLARAIASAVPFKAIETRLLRDDAPKPVKDRALAELRDAVAARATSGRVLIVPLLLSPGAVADEIPAILAGLDFAWNGHTLLPDDRMADWILARAAGAWRTVERPAASRQAVALAEVAGTVTDVTALPVAGATVVVRDVAGGLDRVVPTDTRGAFVVAGLRPAAYEIVASAPGFTPVRRRAHVPGAAALSLVLAPATHEEVVTVVSDTGRLQSRESATLPVTVIGGDAMRAAGYATVGEALGEMAGIVTRRGSEGAGAAGEQVQGIDSRQVLVLIDGEPLVGARGIKSGVVDLDRQSVVGLDRVELVRGAASAVYGSDAIGGVINLIPRAPRRPVELTGHAAGGSVGTADAAAGLGSVTTWGTVFASGGRHQRDAFDLTPSSPDTTGSAFRRHDLTGRLVVAPSPAWLVTGTVTGYWHRQSGRSTGERGPEENRSLSSARTYGVRAEWRADPRTTLRLRAYRGRYGETSTGVLLDERRTPVEPGDLFEGLSKADAELTRWLGDRHQVRGGLGWMRDAYRGRNRIRDTEGAAVTTRVAWGQYAVNPFGGLTATVGLRYDAHSVFGGAVSPKIALVDRVTGWLTARASFGRGFRAPDPGQLYYRFLNPTNFYQVIGNPHLEPERSSSWQMGMEARAGSRGRLAVNYFRNDVTNLIQAVNLGFVASPGQLAAVTAEYEIAPDFDVQLNRLLFLYENVVRAETRGVELSGELRIGTTTQVGGSYAYLRAIDARTGTALRNRHPHHGTVRVDWAAPRGGLRANLRGAFYSSWIAGSTRSVAGTSDIVAPAFALWDLTVFKSIAGQLEAFAALDNLTDSQDPNAGLSSGSPLPIYRPEVGRTFRIGTQWSWMK